MKNFFKRDGLKIFLALFFIATGVLTLNLIPNISDFSSAVNSLVAPLTQVLNKITIDANQTISSSKTPSEYESEIEELKKEIRKLRTALIDYYDVKKENTQYLKFYDFKSQNKSLQFKSSSIIARDPNDLFGSFTLDKGASSGISINDPVITENGLVGRVSSVSSNSCKVSTILSPDFKAGIIDVRTNDSGVIVGNVKIADQNLSAMMYLSAQNSVQIDDIVVTSGLGGVYPKNMPVGKIRELKHDDYDSSLYAIIEPFDDIKNIMDVFIVTDFVGKGDIIASLNQKS